MVLHSTNLPLFQNAPLLPPRIVLFIWCSHYSVLVWMPIYPPLHLPTFVPIPFQSPPFESSPTHFNLPLDSPSATPLPRMSSLAIGCFRRFPKWAGTFGAGDGGGLKPLMGLAGFFLAAWLGRPHRAKAKRVRRNSFIILLLSNLHGCWSPSRDPHLPHIPVKREAYIPHRPSPDLMCRKREGGKQNFDWSKCSSSTKGTLAINASGDLAHLIQESLLAPGHSPRPHTNEWCFYTCTQPATVQKPWAAPVEGFDTPEPSQPLPSLWLQNVESVWWNGMDFYCLKH